jgi:hypothetical protein
MEYLLKIATQIENKTFANTACNTTELTAGLKFDLVRAAAMWRVFRRLSDHKVTMYLVAACALFYWARGRFYA